MLAIADEKFVLIRFRPLYPAGGIRIRVGLFAVALALIRASAALFLIPVHICPHGSGIDACQRGLQEIRELQGLCDQVEQDGVEVLHTDLGAKMA